MSDVEDLMKKIQGFPDSTLLIFTFPSWQSAGDAIMELSFTAKELSPDVSDRRILWKLFVINETGEANVIMGGNMSVSERGEVIARFSKSGQLRNAIYPESKTLDQIKKKHKKP